MFDYILPINFMIHFSHSQILIFCFTYLLTPWSRVPLEKLASLQLVKKLPAFYGTRRFITALTSVRHLSLSWASPIQSSYPNPTSWRSILIRVILPSTPWSPQRSLPLGFPHQHPVHSSPFPHTGHMPRPSHSSRFYHPHDIGWWVQTYYR